MQELGYSFSLTTFSPTGQLWQIQHARAATARGRPSLGLQAQGGVVLVCQRKADEMQEVLIDQSTVKLVETVGRGIGMTYSGLQADFRPVLSLAREITVSYQATYGEEISVKQLAKKVAEVYQENTHQGGVRPYGCAILIAGSDAVEKDGKCTREHCLYQIDPSGSYFKMKAAANGKNNEQMIQALEKRIADDLKNPTLDDAIIAGLGMLRENSDIEIGPGDVVVGIVDKDFRFVTLEKQVVEQYFRSIE